MPPTEEQTYRENVTEKLELITKTLDAQTRASYQNANSLSRIEIKTEAIETQAKFTNGKVRKIIIALVLIAGILIGQNFSTAHDIISLLFSGLHP